MVSAIRRVLMFDVLMTTTLDRLYFLNSVNSQADGETFGLLYFFACGLFQRRPEKHTFVVKRREPPVTPPAARHALFIGNGGICTVLCHVPMVSYIYMLRIM